MLVLCVVYWWRGGVVAVSVVNWWRDGVVAVCVVCWWYGGAVLLTCCLCDGGLQVVEVVVVEEVGMRRRLCCGV